MRLPVVALRSAIILLLMARVVAAPLALPPAVDYSHPSHGFVFRVCSWPPQRLQRFSSSSKLLRLLQGKNKAGSAEGLCLLPPRIPGPSPQSLLFPYGAGSPPGGSANRSTDRLRC
jgi:hypothetical protein